MGARTMRFLHAFCVLLVSLSYSAAAAGLDEPPAQDLKTLSIEELMEIDVSLAARQPEPVRETAAAISVITGEDIRRSGVSTIADAIGLANGVHVARFNNGSWAVSARGFNITSANKLLVMVDGRTEYSPLFTGVFWNMLDYVLEDIERIEVIRGPGAALWGANAVNGVINIITRHSRDTQGTFVSLGPGTEDRALGEVRYGGAAGNATYRVYGKYANRDDQIVNTGAPAGDSRRRGQAGLRIDGGRMNASTWMVKGDAFHSSDSFFDRPDGEFTELALQGRWSRPISPTSRIDVQSYYRREYRRVPSQLTHHVDTIDIDFQHAFTPHSRHNLVWGGGHRVSRDGTQGSPVLSFDPERRTYAVSSLFAQEQFTVRPDRLFVIAGLKMERNAFSGVEWQPSIRTRLDVTPRHTLWGAVSRAVRRPTRLDVDVLARTTTGALVAVGGGEAFEAEKLIAGEIGYRGQIHDTVSVDATLFHHSFDDLRSQELRPSGLRPVVVGNTLNGRSHGLELGFNVQPVGWWRTHLGYTYLDTSITRDPNSRDISGGISEANDPHHLFGLRTSIDLPRRVELDANLRSIGSITAPRVPAYTELNVRIGWRATPHVELAVVGHDLLHDHHPEFGPPLPRREEFERGVRALVTLRWP
jgi:iron complex outermembrane receptor protein